MNSLNWTSKNKGYISSHYGCLTRQYDLVIRWKENNHSDTHRFLCHLIVCQLQNLDEEDYWVPISWELIQKSIPKADWKALVERCLIEYKEFDWHRDKTRLFRIKPEFLSQFIELGLKPKEDISVNKRVNLFDGRHITRVKGNQFTDDSNCPEPKTIKDALNVLKTGYFNKIEVEKYLLTLEKGSSKYYQAMACYNSIMGQNTKPSENPDIWSFRNAYRGSYTARIYFMGGGLQNAPREMKAAAYTGIESLYNYDLTASQLNALVIELKFAGLDSSWIEQYLADPFNKGYYANQCGLSVDLWKQILCALLFGVQFRSEKDNAIWHIIQKELGDKYKSSVAFDKAKDITQPLREVLKEWHEFLFNNFVKKGKKAFITNKTGKKLNLKDLPIDKPNETSRKLAAFFLQGREACFIHELTILSDRFEYEAIANEHDGLVTIGEIPEEAMRLAAEASGFETAELRVKPFISEKKSIEKKQKTKEPELTPEEIRAKAKANYDALTRILQEDIEFWSRKRSECDEKEHKT